MKFAATAMLIAAQVNLALAVPGYPPFFREQCCLGFTRPQEGRTLIGGWNEGADRTNKQLSGWDTVSKSIDPVCLSETPDNDDPDLVYECFSYEAVCEDPRFGGRAGMKVCDNRANCYDPDDYDSSCSGTPPSGGFPDIFWGCFVPFGMLQDDGSPQPKTKTFFCGWKCKLDPEACGDPHFQTWDGEWYDFHGECDLNYMTVPEFGLGLGLDIHLRTKARYEYSYIESAAIKIGDDVLEVSSYGAYAFNGVESADLSQAKFADLYSIEHRVIDAQNVEYIIQTGGNENIKLKSFKDLVSVKTGNATAYNFGTSTGMMGDFFDSKMLARDGKTVIADADEFGLEWQVKEGEPQLFRVARDPSQKCIMPSERVLEGRRLGENVINKAAGEAACAHVDKSKFDNCVFDVVATGDVSVASTYA